MNVGLVSDVKDGIDHLLALVCLPELLGLLIFLSHELVPLLESLNLSCHLLLHRVQHLLLFEYSILSVQVLSLIVLGFSQLPVFNYDTSALIGSPGLVGQLLFLLSLPLHALQDLCLPPVLLHFVQMRHLVGDHSHSSSFSILACFVIQWLLGLASESN